METNEQPFLSLTKNIHHLIYSQGGDIITTEEVALYERVNRENAQQLAQYVQNSDIVVFHDPQPVGVDQELRKLVGITAIWPCHIGLDFSNDSTDAVWSFLAPYLHALAFWFDTNNHIKGSHELLSALKGSA